VQVASWRWVFVINLPLVAVTLCLARAIPQRQASTGTHVDWLGGALGALGLAGPIFALIEQPNYGWGDPRVIAAMAVGCVLLLAFTWWDSRCSSPMLPLGIFRVRNFGIGNLATFFLYGGLSIVSFFLIVFLQQVGGYRPLLAGLSMLPTSVLLFLLARRFGALADRHGPRAFMGIGPLLTAAGLLLLLRVGLRPDYLTDVLPGVFLLGLGLSVTVAPLTSAVLSAAPAEHSGLASGVNNAVSRVAGLIAIATAGAVVAARFSSHVLGALSTRDGTPAAVNHAAVATFQVHALSGFTSAQRPHVHAVLQAASVSAFHLAMLLGAGLATVAGILSLIGIGNPSLKTEVPAADQG
jgi:MFS family permease